MEDDIPNSSNSKKYQITWGSNGGMIGQVKSYKCSFCKRGFSNAQALGGHMNIHRKDRAKLREISIETSDIQKHVSPSLLDHVQAPSNIDESILQQDISSDDMSSPSKRPCVTLEEQQQYQHQHHHSISKEKDENHEGDLLQLPLFVDSPSKEEINCVETQEGNNKDMELSVADSKLDLELRLGPESSIKP